MKATEKTGFADSSPFPLVVIGAPSKDVDSLLKLIPTIPNDLTVPIVLSHQLDTDKTADLIQRVRDLTSMPVVAISGDTPLEAGSLYVVPADRHVDIDGKPDNGVAQVADSNSPSIDRLMASAARVYTDGLVGVLLAGNGFDGIAGVKAIKAYGGTVVVQDPASSPSFGLNEIAPSLSVDVVSDLDAIGPLLGDLLAEQVPLDGDNDVQEMQLFLERIREHSGIDFRAYKLPTIERRLRRRMAAIGAQTLRAYWRHVDHNPEELQTLISSFLIKVTDFFRDSDLFAYLREHVLPDLMIAARESESELRIWSAGCATGEEAYSLAIVIAELLDQSPDPLPVRILATDIAGDAVDFARHGVYPSTSLGFVPPELIERYFVRIDGSYEISKAVRQMVVFGEHDLGNRAPFPRIDLVLCRNVLIYFTPDLQRRVLQRFAFSLKPGGLLVLGKAESTSPLPNHFILEQSRLKVFRRNNTIAPITTDRGYEPPVRSRAHLASGRLPLRRSTSASVVASGQSFAERMADVLDRMSTGVIVVDRQYDILAINVAARRLFDIRTAGIGADLIHQVPQVLGGPLRTVIDTALTGQQSAITHLNVADLAHASDRDLSIVCTPVPSDDGLNSPASVQIEITDVTAFASPMRASEQTQSQLAAERDRSVERANSATVAVRELRTANDSMAVELGRLRAENEQLQLGQEEIQAAAEEIETLNEEQQASNEELETLNEELQATVEELNTANSELQARAEQLEQLAATLEARRRESEEWLHAIVADATDFAIFTTDAAGRIDNWTSGAESALGWSANEAIGQPFDIVFTDEDRSKGVPATELAAARDTGFAPDVRWHQRKDGSQVFIEGSSRSRHRDDGAFLGLLKIGRNATERRLAEQERRDLDARTREHLEQQVAAATSDLHKLSQRLLQIQEEERRRLALELHDEIGQMLTGLGLQLGMIPQADEPRLAEALRTVGELTEQVRQMSMDLRPSALDTYGLVPALEWLIERFSRRTGIAIEMRHEGLDRRFGPAIEIAAYRIAQEGLTNIARHSTALSSFVRLHADDDTLTIVIRDEGSGFDPATAPQGTGLAGMRERAALVGGTLSIDSSPNAGVTITAELPVSDKDGLPESGA